ncbi:uncharacterized protein LOC142550238 [Primulina tabacum]|uniref:uncharacterized protein LOC142550238 n=1 Tax=Primulina tabacum TaxID=48773 RepID=UPI003F59961E
MRALNYVLVEGDLYRKWLDGLLLRCIGFPEALEIMKQVHEGVCGAHQSGIKMRWLIRRYGYYWPSILKDCIKYARGCQSCQRHGNIQRIPTDELHSIVKPSPFKGWAMDLIGKIYPSSSKGYSFILVATDFFTKWSNGQAEASNKVLIKILQMMEENPRDWPRLLSETLWAYRTSKRTATGVSPFSLTFGHDAVLPLEIMVPSMRVAKQNELSREHYNEAMIMVLEELDELRIQAYNDLLLQKQKVARIYNKRVNKKSFHEGEIVWKAILPLGTKDRELGKWSPNWEGPFKVHKVLDGNAYWLSSLDGHPHKRCINGKYLKPYFPSMREEVEKACE